MSAAVTASSYVAGSTFKPTDLSDCRIWLSAQAESALYSDDQSMSGWTDRSGLGNHATLYTGNAPIKWRSTLGPSSGPAVVFPATSYGSVGDFFFIPAIFSGAVAMEVHFGIKATFITESGSPAIFNNSNDTGFFPYSDARIYETMGTTTRRNVIDPTAIGIDSWRRYNVWSATNDYAVNLNETNLYSSSSNTVDLAIGGQGTLKIGAAGSHGAGAPRRFVGSLAFVIAYGRKLTTPERADLVTFMQANPSGGLP